MENNKNKTNKQSNKRRRTRNIQISRGTPVTANPGAERCNDPGHHEYQGRHQETHLDLILRVQSIRNSKHHGTWKDKQKEIENTKTSAGRKNEDLTECGLLHRSQIVVDL